jgi:hypothetical protein
VDDPQVHILRNANEGTKGPTLSLDPEYLATGCNSGFQALNLAVLAGAKKIILLGYDAKEPSRGDKSHWFGEHPRPCTMAAYAMYRNSFKNGAEAIKAADVRVINCSPGSAITAFERMALADCLQPDAA